MKRKTTRPPSTGAPFLRQIVALPELTVPGSFPFTIPAFSVGINLTLRSKVTFFVGENGSGKSTLLEALAECCGFSPEGGSRDRQRAIAASCPALLAHTSWWGYHVIQIHDPDGNELLFPLSE